MSENQLDVHALDNIALLQGLARWRVALSDNSILQDLKPLTFEELGSLYFCVDTDILSMYTNPASGAGYLGLHNYGSAGKVHPKEYASAASLSSSLARYILFDLECQQKSSEPRLLLPAHAEEVQRKYQKANERANLQIDEALAQLTHLRSTVDALAAEISTDSRSSADSATPTNSHQLLKNFIDLWFGPVTQDKPAGLAALEESMRYDELFAVFPSSSHGNHLDTYEAKDERVCHVTRYRFGEPYNGFTPNFELDEDAFDSHYQHLCREFSVDMRHSNFLINELQNGLDISTQGYRTRDLSLATDAYALAWLKMCNSVAQKFPSGDDFRCKLISGAGKLESVSPELVVTPLRLLRSYLLSRLTDEQGYETLESLKLALGSVLDPIFAADSTNSAAHSRHDHFVIWCSKVASGQHTPRTQIKIDDAEVGLALEAWQRLINLISARETKDASSGNESSPRGQSIYEITKRFNEGNKNFSLQGWIDWIEGTLVRAQKRLSIQASRLVTRLLIEVPRKVSRNPPPLRLDDYPQAKEICSQTIWVYLDGRATDETRNNISSALQDLSDRDLDYVVLLLGGLSLCAIGRWRAARSSFDMALKAADSPENPDKNIIVGTEAAYGLAVCWHVTARTIDDLDVAEKFLDSAKSRWNGKYGDRYEVRFATEALSIKLMRCWAAMKDSSYPGNLQNEAVQHFRVAIQLEKKWEALTSSYPACDKYILTYAYQELGSCIVQFLCIARFMMYQDTLYEPSQSAINSDDNVDFSQAMVRFLAAFPGASATRKSISSEDSGPVYSTLLQLNIIVGKLLLNNSLDKNEPSFLNSECESQRNFVIPLVDNVRLTFFKLLCKRLFRSKI
jgi:hypothetical protein